MIRSSKDVLKDLLISNDRCVGGIVRKEDGCEEAIGAKFTVLATGGIAVNYESKTSMDGLYAVGETACNGVHGKNRLASNSLLESMVFAKRAAYDIADQYNRI